MTQKRRLEREFACGLCRKVLQAPYHTPCDHNFCKQCLDGHFAAIDAQTANSSAAAPVRIAAGSHAMLWLARALCD